MAQHLGIAGMLKIREPRLLNDAWRWLPYAYIPRR